VAVDEKQGERFHERAGAEKQAMWVTVASDKETVCAGNRSWMGGANLNVGFFASTLGSLSGPRRLIRQMRAAFDRLSRSSLLQARRVNRMQAKQRSCRTKRGACGERQSCHKHEGRRQQGANRRRTRSNTQTAGIGWVGLSARVQMTKQKITHSATWAQSWSKKVSSSRRVKGKAYLRRRP
jgi:hypothetical protein